VRLVGEKVVLRPARPEDADALAQGFADDPAMGEMLGMEPEQQTAEWLRGSFAEEGGGGEATERWFAIAHPDSGELIGEIGLVDISRPNRRAGLSVLVLPGSRRSGVGREAIELLVRWARGELGLHRIELHTLPENVAMQGSPRRRASSARASCVATRSTAAASTTPWSSPGCRPETTAARV